MDQPRKIFGNSWQKRRSRLLPISVLTFFVFSFSQPFLSQWQARAENPPEPKTADYKIPADIIDSGGGEKAKSSNYFLDDTIGEANIGLSKTANYSLNAGYRQAAQAGPYISLSCSSTVTLPSIAPGSQSTGSGTCVVTTDADAGYSLQWSAQSAGWLSGWSYRKKITVSNANVDSALADFPFLVKIANDTNIGPNSRSDGYDIRFTSATGALLKYERESYSYGSGSGSGVFWVKVPVINSAANTTIYVYYGNSNATIDWTAAGSPTNAQQVWDSNFLGVWHLSESVANGGTLQDSTGNDKDGTWQDADASGQTGVATPNGKGVFFNANDKVSTAITTALTDFTVTAWFKDDGTAQQYERLADKSYTNCFWLGRNSTTSNSWGGGVRENSAPYGVFVTLADGVWHQISSIRSGTTHYIYGDGTSVSNSNTVSNTACDATAFGIGAWGDAGSTQQRLVGTLDEVRLSSTPRTAAWIKFEYYNMNSASNEATWSAQQTEGSDSANMVSQYGDTIAPYTPAVAETAETWSVALSDSEWGGRLRSNSTDTATKWGTDASSPKWLNVPTTNYTVVTRSSRTATNGSTEILQYRAEVGASKHQPTGKYSATITMTAVAL